MKVKWGKVIHSPFWSLISRNLNIASKYVFHSFQILEGSEFSVDLPSVFPWKRIWICKCPIIWLLSTSRKEKWNSKKAKEYLPLVDVGWYVLIKNLSSQKQSMRYLISLCWIPRPSLGRVWGIGRTGRNAKRVENVVRRSKTLRILLSQNQLLKFIGLG